MIPKIIHYCWFGGKEKPAKEKMCIETWKKFLPDYQIIEWNEENVDLDATPYCRQAYDLKKYAFVSDYVRTKVLYEYGGLYLDTDFKIIKPLEDILTNGKNIVGWETRTHVGTAILAFEKGHSVMKRFLDYYNSHPFVDRKGRMDNIANVAILTDILVEDGAVCNRLKQELNDITIYNRELFYPKKLEESEFRITEETVGVHMCSGSWYTEKQRKRGNNKFWLKVIRPVLILCRSLCLSILGKERARNIEIIIRNFLK
jgi:mannosyltransferase OCH1-like enzyme